MHRPAHDPVHDEAAARAALVTVGLPPDLPLEPTAGRTGRLWRVLAAGRDYALRLPEPDRSFGGELAAMDAARAAGLPVPEVLVGAPAALLLAWMPGTPMLDLLLAEPHRAGELGRSAGAMQARLHDVAAPPELGPAETWRPVAARGVPSGDRLLHLDWHPANLLVGADGAITAALDWTNARRGHPLLDLARTESVLGAEPSAADLGPGVAGLIAAFRSGWADGYGRLAREIPAACLAWAGRSMLADLGPRYADAPERLDGVRVWTRRWA